MHPRVAHLALVLALATIAPPVLADHGWSWSGVFQGVPDDPTDLFEPCTPEDCIPVGSLTVTFTTDPHDPDLRGDGCGFSDPVCAQTGNVAVSTWSSTSTRPATLTRETVVLEPPCTGGFLCDVVVADTWTLVSDDGWVDLAGPGVATELFRLFPAQALAGTVGHAEVALVSS